MLKVDDRPEAVVELLRERKVVDEGAIDRARRAAKSEKIRLDLALVKLGLASEAVLADAYAIVCDHPLVTLRELTEVSLGEPILPASFMERARALAISVNEGELRVAMADPLDRNAIRAIEMKTGLRVRPVAAKPSDIDVAISRQAGIGHQPTKDEASLSDLEKLRSTASDAPVVRLVDSVIGAAVEKRASDIHFLPSQSGLRIRMRIDGHLVDIERPNPNLAAGVLSRIKLMASLDIAERRLPQDGRIRLVVRGQELDLRVSVAPTIEGESIVIRILDGGGAEPDFDRLGISRGIRDRIAGLLEQPSGVTIVTGPTGSGKTTTLYAALRRLNRPDQHIATIEDPVEYRLEGINQIQVRPEIGFDFPDALRHLLRHDPDVVMVGEIRDGETAQIALQSALTGHPVLATLHTNDATSTVPRLIDMGTEPYMVAAVLNGAVAQRLVRKLCPSCSLAADPPADVKRVCSQHGIESGHWRSAVGCEHCHGTGYSGRTVVAEVMIVDDVMRSLIRHSTDAGEIRRAAIDAGMTTLQMDALRKAAEGVTSLDEVARATGRIVP